MLLRLGKNRKTEKLVDVAEAWEKQRTITVVVGRPWNLHKSRVSQPFGEKRGKRS